MVGRRSGEWQEESHGRDSVAGESMSADATLKPTGFPGHMRECRALWKTGEMIVEKGRAIDCADKSI